MHNEVYVPQWMWQSGECWQWEQGHMAKFDKEAAYRTVPVHLEDRWLLGMLWKDKLFVDTTYHAMRCSGS